MWFAAAARMREQRFTEQTIVDYDSDMRGHLTATIQALVAVAHRDATAFRALDDLAQEVWHFDGQMASLAADYWSNPEVARERIGGMLGSSYQLEQRLPHRIVGILNTKTGEETTAPQEAAVSRA